MNVFISMEIVVSRNLLATKFLRPANDSMMNSVLYTAGKRPEGPLRCGPGEVIYRINRGEKTSATRSEGVAGWVVTGVY